MKIACVESEAALLGKHLEERSLQINLLNKKIEDQDVHSRLKSFIIHVMNEETSCRELG